MTDRYGCWNTMRNYAYPVSERPYSSVRKHFVDVTTKVVDTSSTECRYDRRAGDPKCEGCKK